MTGVQTCALPILWAGKKAEDPPNVAEARKAMLGDTEDEYRRLLYVAMTRAKDDLYLVQPQRFFTHQQSRGGDRHVYAPRSRFITAAILDRFQRVAWVPGAGPRGAGGEAVPRVQVDIRQRLRERWR